MQRINAITLDLDDTLWAIAPVIARAERVLAGWFAEHYPRIAADWDDERQRELREQVISQHAARAHDLRFLRETVLERMAAETGYDKEMVAAAFKVFDKERNIVELFPDVLPGLEDLAGEYRLMALTNGNACLDTIGIRGHFFDVVNAVEAGAAKPDERIFKVACERVGCAPEEVLHVGDHPHLDVEGARQVGMRTAWVNRTGAEWPDELAAPDVTVSTLHELSDWLRALARSDRQA